MSRHAAHGAHSCTVARARWVVTGAAMMVVALALMGCGTAGERVAGTAVNQVADALTDQLDSPVSRVRDAEWFAATYIPDLNSSGRGSTVYADTLAWSGNSRDDAGARIEVRIRVDVEAETGYFGSGHESASSTKCFRYEVFVRPNPVLRHGIACPNDPEIMMPSAVPFPTLPDNAEDVLAAVLAAASPTSLDGDVRAAFPQDFVTVDTDTVDGDLLAAVGVSAERECIVGGRGADGVVEFWGYDPTWIEPGELGCTTSIVTSPPL